MAIGVSVSSVEEAKPIAPYADYFGVGAIWFAGLWDSCQTADAGAVRSFTILTGPSAGWLGDYHNRAPVILEEDERGDWLNLSGDPSELFSRVRPERFELAA